MTKFSDLKLDPKVLAAITDAGYETPTPIQAGAIPPALEGRDVLGIAQTGTGKTASFTLPMITLLGRGRARARMPRSLVLCPTRELAAQVAENFDIYAKNTRLTKALLIGGVSFGEQDKLIDRGVDVLIATPGRLLDHFERGKLLLTGVQIMVVDEADRMLDMGFIPDIERIFQLTPFTRQTLFFSATMAPEIERITSTFLHNPERIEVARQATTSETIEQRLVELTPTRKDQTAKQKRELLRALIAAEGDKLTNAIVFCNRKTDVDIVAKSLQKHGFNAAPIHGDLDQSQRMRTLDSFRDGGLTLLIASDVAARGLDIPAVSHVFNYDLPSHAEDYVHRIGRTGRAGRLGTAVSLSTPMDEKYLTAIENLVKKTLPRAPQPEGFSLSEAAHAAPRSGASRSGSSRSRSSRARRDEGKDDRREDKPAEQPEMQAEAPHKDDRSERRDDRRDDRRNGAERNGNGYNRDNSRYSRDRGGRDRDQTVGMGDHMPEFLTRSFLPEDLNPNWGVTDSPAELEAPVSEAVSDTPADTTETPKKTGSRSRSRSRKTEVNADQPAAPATAEVVMETAAVSETAETEAATETEVKPAPKTRRTSTRKTAAKPTQTAPEADLNAEAEPEAAPVKKTRKPSTRKTAASTATTTGEAALGDTSSDEAAAPVPAKKATTKKTTAKTTASKKTTTSRTRKKADAAEAPAADTPADTPASPDNGPAVE